jgi:hypothetical protein
MYQRAFSEPISCVYGSIFARFQFSVTEYSKYMRFVPNFTYTTGVQMQMSKVFRKVLQSSAYRENLPISRVVGLCCMVLSKRTLVSE